MFNAVLKKRLFVFVSLLTFAGFCISARHPFYLSVTTIKHSSKDKTLSVTCKLFTNDFEDALRKIYKAKVDLINGTNRQEQDQWIMGYLKTHLSIKVNGRTITYKMLGFEQEADAVWCYLEASAPDKIKAVELENTILYDFIKEQVNICQVEVSGVQKSAKVSAPEKSMSFLFDKK